MNGLINMSMFLFKLTKKGCISSPSKLLKKLRGLLCQTFQN